MTFDIEADGEIHSVTIEPDAAAGPGGGVFRVTVRRERAGDRALSSSTTTRVDARRTDSGLSMVVEDTRRTADAAITMRPGGECLVQLPHVDVSVLIDGHRRRQIGQEAVGMGAQRITAPMPGRVLRVMVAAGVDVVAGQSLLVMEAMKMENDLKAQRAGRVREVGVVEGVSVEAGRLLIVIE